MSSIIPPKDGARLCSHGGCRCEVGPDDDYCSDYCRSEQYTGMESASMSCRCRHEPCGSPRDPGVST